MNIQQLQYFYTVCQNLSFTKSADLLYISRQALSKTILNLEQELGNNLFLRRNNFLEITPTGKKLLEYSEPVITAFQQMEQKIENYIIYKQKTVHVAIGFGTFNVISPSLFTDFQQIHPDISVIIEECYDNQVRNRVKSEDVDLGILGTSPKYIWQFQSENIKYDQLYVQVSNKNTLSQKEQIELTDLDKTYFISLGEECDMHNILVENCKKFGLNPNFVFNTQDANAVNNMVINNRSISFGHIENPVMANNPNISMKPIRIPNLQWGTYMIYRKGKNLMVQEKKLIQYIISHTVSMPIY